MYVVINYNLSTSWILNIYFSNVSTVWF